MSTANHRPSALVGTVSPEVFGYYPRLVRVLRFAYSNLSSPISLQQAANVANLDRKYFSRFFRMKVGLPFGQWLLLLRVQRAMNIIRMTDESLTRVAYRVGFRNPRTFERAFLRLVDCTPRHFKKCWAGVAVHRAIDWETLDRRVTLCRQLDDKCRYLDEICRAMQEAAG